MRSAAHWDELIRGREGGLAGCRDRLPSMYRSTWITALIGQRLLPSGTDCVLIEAYGTDAYIVVSLLRSCSVLDRFSVSSHTSQYASDNEGQ